MGQTVLENRTFDELAIGETASLLPILGHDDIDLFATVSGDVNAARLDAAVIPYIFWPSFIWNSYVMLRNSPVER